MDGHGRPTSAVRESANGLGDFMVDPRKRKIEEVDGHQQEDRVRLGMQFSHESSNISPASYRAYSDFPRSSYPSQMPAPTTAGQLGQFYSREEEENPSVAVRTTVEAPTLEYSRCSLSLSSVSHDGVKVMEAHGHRPVRDRVRGQGWQSDLAQSIGELVISLTVKRIVC